MWFMQQQVYCSNMAKVQEWPSDKKKTKTFHNFAKNGLKLCLILLIYNKTNGQIMFCFLWIAFSETLELWFFPPTVGLDSSLYSLKCNCNNKISEWHHKINSPKLKIIKSTERKLYKFIHLNLMIVVYVNFKFLLFI